jgi:hypothetical protein
LVWCILQIDDNKEKGVSVETKKSVSERLNDEVGILGSYLNVVHLNSDCC